MPSFQKLGWTSQTTSRIIKPLEDEEDVTTVLVCGVLVSLPTSYSRLDTALTHRKEKDLTIEYVTRTTMNKYKGRRETKRKRQCQPETIPLQGKKAGRIQDGGQGSWCGKNGPHEKRCKFFNIWNVNKPDGSKIMPTRIWGRYHELWWSVANSMKV